MFSFIVQKMLCNVSDALEDWEDEIDENYWQEIENPLPCYQYDAFLSIRIKVREHGKPKYNKYEILKNGKWIEYDIQCKIAIYQIS